MKRPWPSPCSGVWQGVEPVVADPEMRLLVPDVSQSQVD